MGLIFAQIGIFCLFSKLLLAAAYESTINITHNMFLKVYMRYYKENFDYMVNMTSMKVSKL